VTGGGSSGASEDQIVIQGDVKDELIDLIGEKVRLFSLACCV
jgi:hypothetical protein